ncbi:MAG: SRPBCC family protein [Vicinamibacteria bacterium]
MTHSVQSIELEVSPEKAFRLLADSKQLPRWTNAFARVENGVAVLRTPRGEVEIELRVHASPAQGTVDWEMRFPDGTVEWAYSRLVSARQGRSVFSFVLLPPAALLENLEGMLEAQTAILTEELRRLKRLLEDV